jgi:hypothetical protein
MQGLQNFGVADGLSDLLEWSEPVIFDCLSEVYRTHVVEKDLIGQLARQHGRAWRALIAGDMSGFKSLRRDLAAALEALGVDPGCIDEADARAFHELNDIVTARFQRRERLVRGYRLALAEIAHRLAPATRAA